MKKNRCNPNESLTLIFEQFKTTIKAFNEDSLIYCIDLDRIISIKRITKNSIIFYTSDTGHMYTVDNSCIFKLNNDVVTITHPLTGYTTKIKLYTPISW